MPKARRCACACGFRGDLEIRLWLAQVGRVPLVLLDTDLPENDPADRPITNQLYVRGREMRMLQEIVLGVGGVRIVAGGVAQCHAKVVAPQAVGVVDAGKPVADVVGVVHFLQGSIFIAMQVFAFEAAKFVARTDYKSALAGDVAVEKYIN